MDIPRPNAAKEKRRKRIIIGSVSALALIGVTVLIARQSLKSGKVASAAIDVSDGFLQDLGHLCEESGVGAVVECSARRQPESGKLSCGCHGSASRRRLSPLFRGP